MIISNKHKFIFIHGRKTAGTSIGISLMRYLGSGDIVRGYITGGLRNGVLPPDWRKSVLYVRPTDLIHENWRVRGYRRFVKQKHSVSSTHLNSLQIKNLVGDEIWENYYKFTFVRNPYDRIVSFFYWRIHQLSDPPTIHQFVNALINNDKIWLKANNLDSFFNWPLYTINDQIAVDKVGCFNRLKEDITEICSKIGISFDGWLPRNKSGIKPDRVLLKNLIEGEMLNRLDKILFKEYTHFKEVL